METCKICEKQYLAIWRCPDELWAKVLRTSIRNGLILICPECFNRMAKEKGIELYWECAQSKFPIQK